MKTKTSNITIIGAGISGLLAARQLTDLGVDVTVLDKARGVGGRMSTRRIDDARCDHGAQAFTASTPEFQSLVDAWLENGIIHEWYRDPQPHYCGVGGSNAVCKHLATNVSVETRTRVSAISWEQGSWALQTDDNRTFATGNLLITAPVPQVLDMLSPCLDTLDRAKVEDLRQVQYEPCLAVMAVLPQAPDLPEPGFLKPDSNVVYWIADNQAKGVSKQPSITVLTTPEFAHKHWDDEDDDLIEWILASTPGLDLADPITTQLHRWRYSQPITKYPEPVAIFSEPGPLIIAGDAFGHDTSVSSQVEAAALSGLAAAEALLEKINR